MNGVAVQLQTLPNGMVGIGVHIHTGPFVRFEKVPFPMEEILFDPQTSGGLLFAVAPQDAAVLEAELQAAGLPAKVVGTIGEKQTPEITVTYE